MSEPRIIFSTPHGSRLYGLANQDSDYDSYVVTTGNKPPRHTVDGKRDTVTVGFPAFLRYAQFGSHQAVEALMSTQKMWYQLEDQIAPYLNAHLITGRYVFEKYERTIKAFCYGDYKRRRHAARLSFNLADLRKHGRFDPVMTNDDIELATDLATLLKEDALWQALQDMSRATTLTTRT